jgi:very-short-patch-repair endonuclease
MSSSSIQRRCAKGAWRAELPSVYAFSAAPRTWLQRCMVVDLWAGPKSAIGYRSASGLLGFGNGRPSRLEVVTLRDLKSPYPGITVHRSRQLESDDITIVSSIRVTTPSRTLLDLASVLDEAQLEDALDAALRRHSTTLATLVQMVEGNRAKGHKGTSALRRLLAAHDEAVCESPLETRFMRLVRRFDLPRPVLQYEIEADDHRARVDFAYPTLKIAIEVDGYRYHAGRKAWSRDAARANRLVRLGWRILRFTWDDVVTRPRDVAETIRESLGGAVQHLSV